MAAFQVIGKPAPRLEGNEKVTGAALYAGDVALPGTLWGKVLHSPHAHARILRIDSTAAEKLPGVHAVVTGADIGDGLYGRLLKDIPFLARDRVRFVGERVAAVAAVDEDTAQLALDLIEVEYEELPAVFDVFEAMAPDAPQLHPDFNSYRGVRRADQPLAPGLAARPEQSNAYNRELIERGDVEKGFAEADSVVENTYMTQRMHQGYLEPQTCLIRIGADGLVEVWVSSKVPYNTREGLATAAGIPESQVLIHHAHIGGDFGGKGVPLNIGACYFLAKKTGRPVRIVADYVEEFLAGNPRHAVTVRLKTGVKRDGTLTAHEVGFYADSGAYAGYKPVGLIFGPTQAAGVYRVPNCRVEALHVYTNLVPGGFMRAPGEVQAFFAIESHIDEVARAIGMDPLDFRLLNLIEDGDLAGAGEQFEHIRVKETLRAAADAAGYKAPKPAQVGPSTGLRTGPSAGLRTGRGIGIAERPPGGGEGTAEVTLKPDGSVVLGTPIFDQGTGTYTVLRQVAAEELGLPLDRVGLEIWDTNSVAFDSGVAGSRATRIATIVAYEAAQEARKALLRLAAERLGWPEAHLSLRGDDILRSDIEERLPWRELLTQAGREVSGRGHYKDMSRAHNTSFTVQVAEVSVDPETGQVSLLRFTTAHDVGRVINPIAHQGQINGAVVQGFGYALMEELRVEDGRVTNLSFGDYKLPNIRDIVPLTTVLLEDGGGVGPYAVKGIGETPLGPVAAAVANAIADATGARIRDLPITSEKVYQALRRREVQ